MYRLLIVDDDHMIRNGIENAIAWQEHGISEVRTAGNGDEGEDVYRTFHPDIVLTDIRMPGMDGLQLLKKICESGSDTKVIILSGYDDFSYAQKALKHGAYDYLLKTATIEELLGIIHKAIQAISAEREKKELHLKIKEQLKMSLPLLKYKYLNELVHGGSSPETILRRLEFLDLRLPAGSFIVSASEIDDLTQLSGQVTEEECLIYKLGAINIFEELLGDFGVCFETKNDEFVCLYFCKPDSKSEENKRDFLTICEQISSTVRDVFDITLSTGVSNAFHSIPDIRTAYKEAKRALQNKLFTGNGSLVHINDIENFTHSSVKLDAVMENNLLSALKVGDKECVASILQDIFEQIRQQKGIGLNDFYQLCIELLSAASRVLCEFDSGMEDVFGGSFLYYDEIRKYKTFTDAKGWILLVFEKICKFILETKILKSKKIIEAAKQYIDKHFSENISLAGVSEHVYISPNYLSSLFSSETGQSLMEYIARKRIEKAKQLLGQKDAKACEVGEIVGYDNPYYFSRIFKKYTGLSPSEYKESLR